MFFCACVRCLCVIVCVRVFISGLRANDGLVQYCRCVQRAWDYIPTLQALLALHSLFPSPFQLQARTARLYPDLFAIVTWCVQKQLALLKQLLQLRQY